MAKSKYTFGILIGRFQPFHNAHLAVVKESLEKVGHLIIILGGAAAPRTSKNPWTVQERTMMIQDTLTSEDIPKSRYTILAVQDYWYNEQKWISEVQAKIMSITKGNYDITLLGHKKDRSSYYLMNFPEWDFSPTNVQLELDATEIRQDYFQDVPSSLWQTYAGKGSWATKVPPKIKTHLERFKGYDLYETLREELLYINKYKEEQKKYPYPIIFVTVDAVVVRSGHVLVIRRGDNPGKGQYALPGGFIDPNESILESTLRELREETNIKILPDILQEAIKETRVFDNPGRSLRGRTITHATYFDLGGGQLPLVAAGDDAAQAEWLSINDVMAHPDWFFEDHHSIIYSFLMRY